MNWETQEFIKDAIRAILVILLWIVILVFLFGRPVHAHDWFDEACCDKKDCHPIDADEVTFDGQKYFWRSKLSGELHVFHKDSRTNYAEGTPREDKGPRIRTSLDGGFYGCEAPRKNDRGEIVGWIGYCLYLPGLI